MGPKKTSGRNISYVKPSEPAFLKRLKEQVGFKEGPTIETKKERPQDLEDNDVDERDDELPVVVVLKPGDLSQEEADEIINKIQDNIDPESKFVDEKITFKKPEKRNAGEDLTMNTTKKRKSEDKKPKKVISDIKQINNKGLLSFNDEEDDD